MKKLKWDLFIILSISILLVLILSVVSKKPEVSYTEYESQPINENINEEISYEYGLADDSFNISHHNIRRNQNLSDILTKNGLSFRDVDNLIKASKGIFNVRKIKSGNRYTLYKRKDNDELCFFVYEENPVDFIVFSFQDSIIVYREKKETQTIKKYTTGIIETSLWNSMKAGNTNPYLAVELSEIYAWAIDFFGIQKGDSYRVIYEEEFVDSVSIGIKNIHAACFTHYGTEYWAFEYEQDSIKSYFDDIGNSLRKAFLKSPLRYSRISSRFSHSRFHPVLKIRRPHHGIDYAAPSGTPVHSIGDGVVIKKGYQKAGGGRYVKIKHNSVYTTVYMHFSGYGKGINTGTRVTQGQIIGYVGRSGLATGPHLDFRVYKNGHAIDPLKLKSPPVAPVHKGNMNEYLLYTKEVIKEFELLENINKI